MFGQQSEADDCSGVIQRPFRTDPFSLSMDGSAPARENRSGSMCFAHSLKHCKSFKIDPGCNCELVNLYSMSPLKYPPGS